MQLKKATQRLLYSHEINVVIAFGVVFNRSKESPDQAATEIGDVRDRHWVRKSGDRLFAFTSLILPSALRCLFAHSDNHSV